ncbi:MAG: VTT domain-containing protein [Candidatus Nitrosopolaris sp.]
MGKWFDLKCIHSILHRLWRYWFSKTVTEASEDKSTSLLKKYGWTILFISPWISIIGDYIPIVAGATKNNFRLFTIAIVSGKVIKGKDCDSIFWQLDSAIDLSSGLHA